MVSGKGMAGLKITRRKKNKLALQQQGYGFPCSISLILPEEIPAFSLMSICVSGKLESGGRTTDGSDYAEKWSESSG